MPRGKKNKPKSVETSEGSCAICATEIDKEETATCLVCNNSVHRYCAGVPLEEFQQSNGRFTCSTCLRKQHEAQLAELTDTVTALKAEILELRAALNQVETTLATSANQQSTGDATTWAKVVSRGRRRRQGRTTAHGTQPRTTLDKPTGPGPHAQANTGATATEASRSDTPPPHSPMRKEKVIVKGKRKVWGTHKVTTARAVKNAINSIASTGGIEVKRKYQLSKLNSQKATVTLIKWWFIVSGEESILAQLSENWNDVKLQTGWSLGPVLIYATSEEQVPEQQIPSSQNCTELQSSNPLNTSSTSLTEPNQQPDMSTGEPAGTQQASPSQHPPSETQSCSEPEQD